MAVNKYVKIAAHRGMTGYNIPGNTLAAFDLAIRYGADVIELDATKSADGTLFVFHPQTERVALRKNVDIRRMSDAEIRCEVLCNEGGDRTVFGIPTLREALEHLRDRCIINIDKFADNPAEIAALVREMKMQDQVYVKNMNVPENHRIVEEVAWDLPYMPFVHHTDPWCEALNANRRIRYVGVEAVFDKEEDEVASRRYVEKLHAMGKEAWANGIVFDYKRVIAAGHNDDVSMLEDADQGWGWLVNQGFDIIQTDWVPQLKQYLISRGISK